MRSLYSLSHLTFNAYYTLLFLVLLLSMAGIPPFIGFFSKIFIIHLLVSHGFFLIYLLLIVVFLLGLYFYMQNVRFINSTNLEKISYPSTFTERSTSIYYYFSLSSLAFIFFGVVYIDDLLLFSM